MLVELKKKWLNERCIQSPASPSDIAEFERWHNVSLPADLRDYFSTSNGTNSNGDKNLFEFFPLDKLLPWDKTQWKNPAHPPTGFNPNEYFIFVDYLQSCWGYAIQLHPDSADGGKVMTCGWVNDEIIANSFTKFLELYLNDASGLYPPAQSNAK